MRGIFITLEGGDGSGKTTQINRLADYFREKGRTILITREPGGSAIGEKLRDILLDKNNSEMDAVTEMMIYASSRAQHVREVIMPALERGEVVICDRFTDSSIAYQAYGRGLGDMVTEVNNYATGGLKPDITFWLDIDPDTGRKRAARAGEPDRLELEDLRFHAAVRDGYERIAAAEPGRVKRIDASASVDEIADIIRGWIEGMLAE